MTIINNITKLVKNIKEKILKIDDSEKMDKIINIIQNLNSKIIPFTYKLGTLTGSKGLPTATSE